VSGDVFYSNKREKRKKNGRFFLFSLDIDERVKNKKGTSLSIKAKMARKKAFPFFDNWHWLP
jgi:hypothetical protein